jgi:hypothetical protein
MDCNEPRADVDIPTQKQNKQGQGAGTLIILGTA